MKLTVTAFVSVDRVVQIPTTTADAPGDGFDLAGWLVPYGDQDMQRWFTDWFAAADAFLMGRKTYEIFSANCPMSPRRTTRSPRG